MTLKINSLKESNDFLNILIDSLSTTVFLVTKDFRVYDVNASFESYFKRSKDNILDKLYGNALGCANFENEINSCSDNQTCDACDLKNAIHHTFKTKESYENLVFENIFNIEGKQIKKYFQFSTKFIHYNGSDYVLVIMDDITEHEEYKIRLEKLNLEKNKFLGIAAHDLRSPISLIQLYSEFLLDRKSDNLDDEQMKILGKIYNTCISMSGLLKDLLDFTKIESGILNLEKENLNYVDFIRNILEIQKIIAHKKDINIVYEEKQKEIKFEFDKSRIEQVFTNLLSNAVKYSNPETTIKIRVKKEKDKVLTEVIDQGVGIPDNEISKIFKPFQKISVKPTGDESSTGLGLAIVKKIIKAHEGEIHVDSKVNKGSNFYFYLPMK